jgi:hypothetical protein
VLGNDLGGPLSLPWLTLEQAQELAHENSSAVKCNLFCLPVGTLSRAVVKKKK